MKPHDDLDAARGIFPWVIGAALLTWFGLLVWVYL